MLGNYEENKEEWDKIEEDLSKSMLKNLVEQIDLEIKEEKESKRSSFPSPTPLKFSRAERFDG